MYIFTETSSLGKSLHVYTWFAVDPAFLACNFHGHFSRWISIMCNSGSCALQSSPPESIVNLYWKSYFWFIYATEVGKLIHSIQQAYANKCNTQFYLLLRNIVPRSEVWFRGRKYGYEVGSMVPMSAVFLRPEVWFQGCDVENMGPKLELV